MFGSIRSIFKWKSPTSTEIKNSSSFLFIISLCLLEDVLLWKKMWMSLLFFVCFNIVFMVCLYRQLNLIQFAIGFSIVIICFDALESWLKYKHRTTCLKRLASHDNQKIKTALTEINNWINRQCKGFIFLRNNNHTKAFLLLQIMLSLIFFIGRYTSGYTILYLLFTVIFFLHKLIPPIIKVYKKVQQNADYWKPEDLPLEDASDSSDNSSSLARNLSIEKMQSLTKDVEVTDSSEDEYIPEEQQPEQYQSSLEVQPSGTWSNAFGVLSNLKGAVVNMVYNQHDDKKRRRIPSVDSSDGFEMVDKNEL
ncbi:uncharacterized protein LOC112052466 isoform X2 [Bicyclus anynana]|uniref:Uncharacterized protein LOC112052466 isoform X2 n=1 Tax=Bicyclus anynana TaxID=110368 RepID=A0A6J1NHW6_BICAN|nr:uncharacterized protein LOC112052466 isoform X2 [Bicyclus anynana]